MTALAEPAGRHATSTACSSAGPRPPAAGCFYTDPRRLRRATWSASGHAAGSSSPPTPRSPSRVTTSPSTSAGSSVIVSATTTSRCAPSTTSAATAAPGCSPSRRLGRQPRVRLPQWTYGTDGSLRTRRSLAGFDPACLGLDRSRSARSAGCSTARSPPSRPATSTTSPRRIDAVPGARTARPGQGRRPGRPGRGGQLEAGHGEQPGVLPLRGRAPELICTFFPT